MLRVARKQNDRIEQQTLAQKKARSIAIRSKRFSEISELSTLRKSLLFAEISLAVYMAPNECDIVVKKLGFSDAKFFNCGGSQAYLFWNEVDCVIVFRGNESTDWNRFLADATTLTVMAETVGKVHSGFKGEVDKLWPKIETMLVKNTKRLWFTGHSIGGAMASISAARCLLSHIKSVPEELFTFGSPRVGDKRYLNNTNIPHFRWVNNNDIVPCLPPALSGYRHEGTEMYLDHKGLLKDVKGWRRATDRMLGFVKEMMVTFRMDQLSDHSIVAYTDAIHNICRTTNQNYNGIELSDPVESIGVANSD